MEADKQEIKILHKALDEWEQNGRLAPEQAASLRETIVPKHTGRQQIAQYFFFIALTCILLAFAALFLNEKLLEKLKAYFSLNDLAIALISAALSVLWFWYTGRKKKATGTGAYEVYMVLGGLAVLTTLVYLCKYTHMYKTPTVLFGLSLPILAALGQGFRSKALWIGAIIAAICWYSSFTEWQSTGYRFLGMNYPMRFTAFALVVLGVSFIQLKVQSLSFGQHITYVSGLILLFTGLWGVSIFGNYSSFTIWQEVRQVQVLAWSFVFGLVAGLSFYLGIRFKDDLARDLGVLFLLINLYTRYFEYCWNSMNKGIFFLILAITFGFVGWWLERKRKPRNLPS